MGLSASLHVDHFEDVKPWSTEIFVVNHMRTPALILEARHHSNPTPCNAIEHHVAPGEHAIMSGYLREPHATLYVRTGLHCAKVLKVANGGRIVVTNAAHGLHIEAQDENVSIEDLHGVDPATIPGSDTIPMLMRNEHFRDVVQKSDDVARLQSSSSFSLSASLHVEHLEDVMKPWSTEIIVVNQMQTPALFLEARNHSQPTPSNAIQHRVPPGEHAIMSGYLQEPHATLYVRTGLHTAKVLKVANAGRIVVTNEAHGLHIEAQDENVTVDDLKEVDPTTIPGNDTIPMIFRNEHFKDAAGEPHGIAEGSRDAAPIGGA
eukprot:TRINITY_DN104081_c0_g1_i1.p1 TRINITY_DN104081_c0_g1~~TRINITY_DN104081_c0_g1_i1.p1  ORF type:complete len:319 (+),score=61.92 TRINITY_DN104081_c0_g1_i1:77-1033(+)